MIIHTINQRFIVKTTKIFFIKGWKLHRENCKTYIVLSEVNDDTCLYSTFAQMIVGWSGRYKSVSDRRRRVAESIA